MKRLCFYLVLCFSGMNLFAQEAHRTEFTRLGSLQMIAYHFPENNTYEFILYGKPEGNAKNGYITFFKGNEHQTLRFLDEINFFKDKYLSDNDAALKISGTETMVHRLVWAKMRSLRLISDNNYIQIGDREFMRVYNTFSAYCKERNLFE